MLAGLLFLGVMAAAAVPDMMDLLRPENGETPPDEDEVAVADDLPGSEPPDALPEPDQAEGEDLFVDPAPGTVVIEAFNRDIDTLTIAIPDEAQEFFARDASGDTPALLGYEIAGGRVEIIFDGLETVPVADIFLRVSDASSPSLDADIALSQLLVDGDPGDETPTVEPVDPTLPDVPGGDGDPDDILRPVDPELPDDPAPPFDGGAVLEPVGDDGPPPDAEGIAVLIRRDGGSDEGLRPGAPPVETLTDGDDTADLSGPAGETGLTLPEAAPVVTGDGVRAIDLGAGDDSLVLTDGYGFGGEGADSMVAAGGAVALFGGEGADSLSGAADPAALTFLHGGAGDDTLTGGAAGEYLDGGGHKTAAGPGSDDDVIDGGAGDDTIRGGWGRDLLTGGAGDDVIDHRGTDAERIIAEHHEFAWHIDGAADMLAGGDGDDTLIFDTGDRVSGGSGDDVFWLYADAAATPAVALIEDFTPGADFLRISLNPQTGAARVVGIVQSADGADALITLDGVTVAVVQGAPYISMADLYIETRADVFP